MPSVHVEEGLNCDVSDLELDHEPAVVQGHLVNRVYAIRRSVAPKPRS
jgi:hypothetical protein